MEFTKEQIEKINTNTPYDQGVYFQPYGVPFKHKELCVYMRYETGGYSGGSCWYDSDPQPYSIDEIPNFDVLDLVLKELAPNLTYLQYKEVEKLIDTNDGSEHEYYGNSTDWTVKFIPISELYDTLNSMGY